MTEYSLGFLEGLRRASFSPSVRILEIAKAIRKEATMQNATRDNVKPGEKWVFDGSVAGCFEDMLKRSIPQYEVMRQTTAELAAGFARDGMTTVDVGCSDGQMLEAIIASGCPGSFLGLEVSDPMIAAAKGRFRNNSAVSIEKCDLRTQFPGVAASVVTCVLTLQFTPIEYRQEILWNIYRSLRQGGALLLVEKVLGQTSTINAKMVHDYYAFKAKNGYSQDQIERKRMSLEGVLVPVTARFNEELMKETGFRHIDCYWRWMNFAAWVAIKE